MSTRYNLLLHSYSRLNCMNQLAQNNPQIKQAMDYVNQCGGDPQKAFYTLAKQKGVDPQQILDALK